MRVHTLHGLAADEPTWADVANLSCAPRREEPPDWHDHHDRIADERQARAEERRRYREEME